MIRSDYWGDQDRVMPQLPSQLRLAASFPFAGRSRERAILRALIPRADGEGLRYALIGGEAGCGKSRLVREFAQEALAAGALVLYGACDPVVRRPYGPFAEVLEQLLRRVDPDAVAGVLGGAGGELSRLLPDLSHSLPGLSAPVAADPDTERHRLHTAVGDVLAAAGRWAPLVIVIEDGHWADTPTLLLLRHLTRGAAEARALLIATFRDTEAEVPDGLAGALADLRRAEGAVRLRLGGLSVEEIAQFVAGAGVDTLGTDPRQAGVLLHDLTGGNAFLITELWRTLLDGEPQLTRSDGSGLAAALAEIGSPEGVREVVAQRLTRLAPTTRTMLGLAAVVGAEFDLGAVASTTGTEAELHAAAEEAIAHGMIEEVPSRPLSLRFTHELVRRALYDRLSALRRPELHLQVGEWLESRYRQGDESRLADLAHHFVAAAPVAGTGRAIDYSILAGRTALRGLDFDDADARFSAALELGILDARRRAQTQLELGTARFRAGRSDDAMVAFRSAAQIARELGDSELLTTAAIGFEDSCWRPGITDQGAIELLEEASRSLDPGDSELRVRLLAGLSRAHAFLGQYQESAVAERQAIAMARRLGDRLGLTTVLMRSYWSHGESSLERTLEMLTEAAQLAEELGEPDLQAEAMEWRVAGLIALGELAAARRELDAVHAVAAQMRQPFGLHVAEHYAATLALCAGDLAEAEAAARRSHEWSRLLTGRPASGVYGIQMFSIRREQGRLAELAAVARLLTQTEGGGGVWGPGFALLLAELGMEEEARRELDRLRCEGLDRLRPSLWVAGLTYLAEACALVGDVALAELIYPELAPLSGGNVVVGHGVACYGAADRFLGVLAATLGDHERATDHFERALEINARMGAATWTAHALHDYGRALVQRGGLADAAKGAELLSEAAALAGRLGLPALRARAHALGARRESAGLPPDGLSWREVEILRLVAAGQSNREIGAALCISGHTVANHVRSILRKTAAANRTEAAGYAHRNGLVQSEARR
jgi:DNA-binding CsgD family transcriptional regulator/tetratricopeptide (TPR) repeat protein